MKYGLFSDVHSNLEAFEVVLEALKKEKVDSYVFLGDIVGYGANPEQCIRLLQNLIKESDCACIAGNHDYAVCGLSGMENFNTYAQTAVDWTKKQLNDSDMEFLAQLKLVQRIDNFTIVHANLTAPQKWGYIFDIDDAYPNFKALREQICFIGHSHKPIVFAAADMVNWFVEKKIILQENTRYIINIGSVGQPRDGNFKSSFAVYDSEAGLVEIRRLSYDVKITQEKIIKAGLPKILAERLSIGK